MGIRVQIKDAGGRPLSLEEIQELCGIRVNLADPTGRSFDVDPKKIDSLKEEMSLSGCTVVEIQPRQ